MIKPVGDYILIEPMEEETVRASGLVVPETAKEKPQRGKVVALGSGVTTATAIFDGILPKDVVIYKRWEGVEVEDEGKMYILIQEEHILGVKE